MMTTRRMDGLEHIPQGYPGRPYRFVARYDRDGELAMRTYRGLSAIEEHCLATVSGRCDFNEREIAEGKAARLREPITIYKIDGDEEAPWREVQPADNELGALSTITKQARQYDKQRAEAAAAKRAEIEKRIVAQIEGRYGGTMRPGDVAREVRAAMEEQNHETN